jgi:hypothetical protein
MTANRRPRSAPDDRGLRLWKVGWALTTTFVGAVLIAGSVFYSLVVLLDFRGIDHTTNLDAKTLFDLVKLSFGVVAGAGALVALVVAYRRQRVDEAGRQVGRLQEPGLPIGKPPGSTPTASVRPSSNSVRTPQPSDSAASMPWPASPTTPPDDSLRQT